MKRMDDFKNGKIIIITNDTNEAVEFFKECEKEGIRWASGMRIGNIEYSRCFGFDRRRGFGHKIDKCSTGVTYGDEEVWDDDAFKQKEKIEYCLLSDMERYTIELPA